MQMRLLLALVALLVMAAAVNAGPPFYVGAYEADHEFSRITAADMEVIRSKHVLLASRSFGLCIMNGVSILAAGNPMYALNRSPTYDVNNNGAAALPPDVFGTFDMVHYLCTLNPTYNTRMVELNNYIRSNYFTVGSIDAVMLEYHFCDATYFPTYQATLDALQRDFPGIKFIYVTSGYMIDSTNHASNVASAQFGALSRAAYMGVAPLYDMAKIISTDPAGNWIGDFLLPEYNLYYPNGDNTHPNTNFVQERMGKAFLLLLYKMFCELPVRAAAGTDQYVIDTDSDGSVAVTLDGSGSWVQNGIITNYVWKEGETVLASTATASVTLSPYGTHYINLYVTDSNGNTDRDDVTIVTKANSLQAVYQIAASADDTQFTSTGNSVTSALVMWPYNTGDRRSAMRWAINIPKGSTILEAKISTCSNGQDGSQNNGPILEMRLFNYDSCPAFSTNPYTWPVSSNAFTWVMGPGKWQIDNVWYDSPDMKVLVEEFMARPGYNPGNYLGLRGVGMLPAGQISWKYVYQWDRSATDHVSGAKLKILYREPVPNQLPAANAGADQLLTSVGGASVMASLNGSASSDSDGTISSYIWKDGAAQIASGQTAQATLAPGLHAITLTVTDNSGATASDTVIVDVNRAPTANAGPDQTVTADVGGSALVTLDASGSGDADGSLVDWSWKEGANLLIEGGVAVRQLSLGVGVHTLTLIVADEKAATGQDTTVITVEPSPVLVEVAAGLDQSWVYQNTPLTTGGRHALTLTVAVSGAASYTVAVLPDAASVGGVAIQPTVDPLVWIIRGGQRATDPAGAVTLNVTVTPAVGSPVTAQTALTVRLLGDIDGVGGVSGQDKLLLNKRLNGLVPEARDFDLDGLGGSNGQDKLIINKVLNGLLIP